MTAADVAGAEMHPDDGGVIPFLVFPAGVRTQSCHGYRPSLCDRIFEWAGTPIINGNPPFWRTAWIAVVRATPSHLATGCGARLLLRSPLCSPAMLDRGVRQPPPGRPRPPLP